MQYRNIWEFVKHLAKCSGRGLQKVELATCWNCRSFGNMCAIYVDLQPVHGFDLAISERSNDLAVRFGKNVIQPRNGRAVQPVVERS